MIEHYASEKLIALARQAKMPYRTSIQMYQEGSGMVGSRALYWEAKKMKGLYFLAQITTPKLSHIQDWIFKYHGLFIAIDVRGGSIRYKIVPIEYWSPTTFSTVSGNYCLCPDGYYEALSDALEESLNYIIDKNTKNDESVDKTSCSISLSTQSGE